LSVCGVIVLVFLMADCSSSGPTPPLADDTPQESALPVAESQEESAVPAEASPQASTPPAGAAEEVSPPPPSAMEEESAPPASPAEPVTGPAAERYTPRTGNGVDVVYFEAKDACGCMAKVRDAVETAILTHFQDELQSGELRYFVIVSNLPENDDLVEMFDAQVYGLSVAEFHDGQMMAQSVGEIWIDKNSPSKVADIVHTRVLSSLEALR